MMTFHFLSVGLRLLYLLCTVTVVTGQCSDPGVPDDGYVISPVSPIFPMESGNFLQFECDVGYTLYTFDVITCDGVIWDNHLPLCTNLTNVGLGRTTTNQSSYLYSGATANSALDGNYDSNTQSLEETSPWWYVDLEDSYGVRKVLIGFKSLNWIYIKQVGLVVRIGPNEDFTTNTQCGPTINDSMIAGRNNNPIVLDCDGLVTGRYVSVSLEGITNKLFLAEVEILGTGVCESDPGIPVNSARGNSVFPVLVGGPPLVYTCNMGYTMYGRAVVECIAASKWTFLPICTDMANIALNRATEMSSTDAANKGSEKAVDGNFNTYFQTTKEQNPWWMVDLGDIYEVYDIHVKNRDRFLLRWNSLVVRVGMDNDAFTNPTCGIQIEEELKYLQEASMTCVPPRKARYVSAHLQIKANLHLVEVMVFGVATHTTTSFVQTTFYDWTSTVKPYGTTMTRVDATTDVRVSTTASHSVFTTTMADVNDIPVYTVTHHRQEPKVTKPLQDPEVTNNTPSSIAQSDWSPNLLSLIAIFVLAPICILVGLYIAKRKFVKRGCKKIKPTDNNVNVLTKTKVKCQSSAI